MNKEAKQDLEGALVLIEQVPNEEVQKNLKDLVHECGIL